MGCLQSVVTRFAVVILLFLVHNFVFRTCEAIGLNMYCNYTFHFNDFLRAMMVKLLSYGFLHLVRKIMGLNLVVSDLLGYFVVYAALFMVFYIDSASWIQFGYNVLFLGSLFRT